MPGYDDNEYVSQTRMDYDLDDTISDFRSFEKEDVLNNVNSSQQFKDLQMFFNEDALYDMSNNELLELVSYITTTGIHIFFDTFESVDPSYVLLKSGEKIPIRNISQYNDIFSKFTRYKVFRLTQDKDNKMSESLNNLIVIEDRLDLKLAEIEKSFDLKVESLYEKLTVRIGEQVNNLTLAIKPVLQDMQQEQRRSTHELQTEIQNIKSSAKQLSRASEDIKTEELNSIVTHLGTVSKLLAEVVE